MGPECFLLGGERACRGTETLFIRSQGAGGEEAEGGWRCFFKSWLHGGGKKRPEKYGPIPIYQPRTRWPPPAVGWAELGEAWHRLSSQGLCQRLDVAGGDRTKVSECASWAPAFLAVRTGLGNKHSPWVYFCGRHF